MVNSELRPANTGILLTIHYSLFTIYCLCHIGRIGSRNLKNFRIGRICEKGAGWNFVRLRTLHLVFWMRISRLIVQNAQPAPDRLINTGTDERLRRRRPVPPRHRPAPRRSDATRPRAPTPPAAPMAKQFTTLLSFLCRESANPTSAASYSGPSIPTRRTPSCPQRKRRLCLPRLRFPVLQRHGHPPGPHYRIPVHTRRRRRHLLLDLTTAKRRVTSYGGENKSEP